MKTFTPSRLFLAIAFVALAGCNNSDTKITELPVAEDPGHGHDHHAELPVGRLAISESDQPVVHIFDLESNQLIETVTLTNPASALYASPDNRFAVAVQRNEDTVEFIDGGLWQELHGDHYDQHKDEPSLTSFSLTDARPTHYVPRADKAAVFFDGNKDTDTVAGLAVLDDESIATNKVIAEHHFDTYMHGTAEIRGDYVLTTLRDPSSESTLPEQITLLEMHGDHFHQEQVFDVMCPALHGSYQTEDYIAFACGDGIVSIKQDGSLFSAQKLANPATMPEGVRIGSLKGSEESNVLIGLSRGGVFLVDLEENQITPFEWQPEPDVNYLSYGFDGHHEHMAMLDNTGKLNLYAAEDNWQLSARIDVFDSIEADAKPIIIASKAHEHLYVIHEHHVMTVNLETQEVTESIHLDFDAGKAAWLGIKGEHEHDH